MSRAIDAWEELANAVVLKAVQDYQYALSKPKGSHFLRECEKFFSSEYFKLFTKVDGVALMIALKEGTVYNGRTE